MSAQESCYLLFYHLTSQYRLAKNNTDYYDTEYNNQIQGIQTMTTQETQTIPIQGTQIDTIQGTHTNTIQGT